jgi:chloramphenicol O-acetyltransferase type A
MQPLRRKNKSMPKNVDVESWNRKNTYEFFKDYEDPFFNITANLDVTALYRFCKEKNLSFALSNLFYSLRAANEIREFRIRLQNEKLIEFEQIHATQTILQPDETFSFCYFEMKPDVFEFNEAGRIALEKYKKLNTFDVETDRLDLIYYSVIPWISFTSFKHASRFDKLQTIPRIVFGKVFDDAQTKKMPMSVEVQHAIMDGFHVGKFFSGLQEKFNEPV